MIEDIRKECIGANPSILELTFGCEIKIEVEIEEWGGERSTYRTDTGILLENPFDEDYVDGDFQTIKYFSRGYFCEYDVTKEDIEILGRTIRLADVLHIIEVNGDVETPLLTTEGMFVWYNPDTGSIELKNIHWNLIKDDLVLQSPEAVSFIHSIINKE